MAFLLSVTPRDDGTTRIEYDVSPVDRVQMVTLNTSTHQALDVAPDSLIGLSLTDIRAPARTRRRNHSTTQGV